jgi:fatty acid desaturase
MNLLPIEMRQVQDEQRQEKIALIHKFQDKLNFSVASLVFFLAVTAYTFFVPLAGIGMVAPILAGIVSLVFIQQTIRSYNYREFHKNNYRFMEGAYEAIEEGLKMKED